MQLTSMVGALKKALAEPKEPTAIVEHPADPAVVPAKFERASLALPRCLLCLDAASADVRRAIVEAIRRERLWATGEALHEADLVAVVDGGAHDFTCRGWGALLAEAWCDPADPGAYVVFAWGVSPSPAPPPGARTVAEVLDARPAETWGRPRSGFSLRDLLPPKGAR